ncbi:hypothetical protein KPH14_007599 [Odynerus spinipes]|uniref:Transmembrane protein n=1 Tax=Odynerus spinipes TaxID=1348599 RepID=A0AAD9VMI8_9HYME|nr:hypothetical protein KPH14_007599 [Odynerus spinipes]
MRTKTNLVAFLLLALFCCLARALQNAETISTVEEEDTKERTEERISELRAMPNSAKIIKASNKLSTHGGIVLSHINQLKKDPSKKDRKQNVSTKTTNGKTDSELRGRPKRKKRRKRNRALMALLLAYKMKFIALIPTMLGGLVLLIGKALLAGFFFALFAAVLSLRSH